MSNAVEEMMLQKFRNNLYDVRFNWKNGLVVIYPPDSNATGCPFGSLREAFYYYFDSL